MPATDTVQDFRRIPHALCERARRHWDEVEAAPTTADQLKALFLAQSEAHDALKMMPTDEEEV